MTRNGFRFSDLPCQRVNSILSELNLQAGRHPRNSAFR